MATPRWLHPKFSDLKTCETITRNLVTNLAGEATTEEIAKILDSSSTSSYFKLKLNSVRAYGLVDFGGDRVKVTPLGRKITTPLDAGERANGLLSAMGTFPIFKTLTEKYYGKATGEPEKQFIENQLLAEGKVQKDKASEWADCFLASARYAGLFSLHPASFLDEGQMVAKTHLLPGSDKTKTDQALVESDEIKPGWLMYPVPVPGGMARIIVPSDLSRSAWEKLKKLLDAIEPEKQGETKLK